MNINVVGWYGKNNVGDEAFKVAHQYVFAGHNVRFVTPPEPYSNPDIVVLGGGAVVSPFYLDTLPDCPRYALGVDIAYESEIDLLAKYNFREVYVRNATDLAAMQKKLSCRVEAMPDLAFWLRPSGEDVLSRYRRSQKPAIGVLVTDYVNPAIDRPVERFAARAFDFKIQMARELDRLVKHGYEPVLIPCSTGGYGDDRRINFDLLAYMQRATEATNILDTLTPQTMIDLIAQLHYTVCMRFHAHLFSVIAGTPFVSIEFTRKVKLFLAEQGMADATVCRQTPDGFEMGNIVESLVPRSFSNVSEQNRRRLEEVFRQVRSSWLQ